MSTATLVKPDEKHYTVQQIGELWNLDPKSVRDIFRMEPGVFQMTNPARRNKRAYSTIRIPESVLQRVHHRMLVKGKG